MNKFNIYIFSGLCLLAAGRAGARQAHTPEEPAQGWYKVAEAEAGSSRPLEMGECGAYGSMQFGEFIRAVVEGNLTLMAESLNIPISEQLLRAERVVNDPELSFEGGDDYYSLELGYTFELGRKRGARIAVAREELSLEQASLAWMVRELRAEAAMAYADALFQREMLAVKRDSYDYMLQLSRSDSIRHALGEITANEALQTRVAAAANYGEMLRQQGEYFASAAALGGFLGTDDVPVVFPGGTLGGQPGHYDAGELLEAGVARSAELEVARREMDLSMQQVRLARAESKPDVELFVGFERDWKGFVNSREMLKGGVTIPLKFSSLNKGTLRAAEYSAQRASLGRQAVDREVRTSIIQAWFAYDAATRELEQYRSGLLEDALTVVDGIEYRYRRGESDILELLVARRTYNEVQEQYLEVLLAHALSLIELQRVCGIWEIDF